MNCIIHILLLLLLVDESISGVTFCDKKVCKNDEECKETNSGYSCTKLFNSTKDICDDYPCGQELKCEEIEENSLKMGFTCICDDKNEICLENSPTICANEKDVCYNGGICQLNGNDNGYVCSCKMGKYSGDFCTELKMEMKTKAKNNTTTTLKVDIQLTQPSNHFGIKRKMPSNQVLLINIIIISMVIMINSILCILPMLMTKYCNNTSK